MLFRSSNKKSSSIVGSALDAYNCLGKIEVLDVELLVVVVVVVVVVLVGGYMVAGAIKITHARQFSITWRDPLMSSLQRKLLARLLTIDRRTIDNANQIENIWAVETMLLFNGN